jgi:hypothetical protein
MKRGRLVAAPVAALPGLLRLLPEATPLAA